MRKIVSTYIDPDMDGTALMYAYTEYLKNKNIDAYYYFEGNLKNEAKIVLDKFKINYTPIKKIEQNDKFILVDTNGLRYTPNCIDESNVIEIIDHHEKEGWNNSQNVKMQIEFVGAASTLVAEKFYNENIPISKESAILLYYGIISNTMNLKIKMTTNRDKKTANLIEKATDIKFDGIKAKIDELRSRKEIVKIIRKKFSKN